MGEVPIADPDLGPEERERAGEVIESGALAAGEVVREFEDAFADYCGADHAVGIANGTAALHAVLEAYDVEPGQPVITTPFSFVATANAIRFAGGVPRFADIDPETYNLDPESVEALLRETDEEVAAIVPVHLYGLPAEMDRLQEVADRHDVPLVADAAQAHGAEYRGEPAGSLADASVFSFYPTKNMTTGEGGMVTTDDEEVANRIASFINHGRGTGDAGCTGYEHVELGHNFRMTNVAAAIGLVQLEKLPGYVEARRRNAARLTEGLADAPVETPVEPEGCKHAYHQYTVRSQDREALRSALSAEGVGSAVYYPTPIHRLPAYDGYDVSRPVAEAAAEEVLSLPVHPEVTEADVDRIAAAVRGTEVTHG